MINSTKTRIISINSIKFNDHTLQSNNYLPQLKMEKLKRKESTPILQTKFSYRRSYSQLSSRKSSFRRNSKIFNASRSRTLSNALNIIPIQKRDHSSISTLNCDTKLPKLDEYLKMNRKNRTFCITDGLSLDAQCSMIKVYEDYIKSELKAAFPNYKNEIPSTPLSTFSRPKRFSDISFLDRSLKVSQIIASAMIILDNIQMFKIKNSDKPQEEEAFISSSLIDIFSKWIQSWNNELLYG
jgi:hypothetical protein